MNRLLCLSAAVLSISQLCSAIPACVNGTLASYIGLGSTGCMIGGNTFSGFQTLSGSSGTTVIASSSIVITPLGGALDPGLTVATNLVASGDALEAIFTYRVSGSTYTADAITLSKSSETGGGDVTDVQNFCADGTFGPDGVSGCSGSAGSLLTLDGVQNQDSTILGPATFLSVTDDFTLDGTFGTARGGTLTDQFTAVPEPATFLFSALGSALVAIKLRANSRQSSKREKSL